MGIFHTHVQHSLKVNRVLIIIVLLSFLLFTGTFADENSPIENEQVKPRKIRNGNIITPAVDNIWSPYTRKEGEARGVAANCHDEYSCLAMRLSEMERQALEAIRTLHGQLDDDANGNIDVTESDEFLREELHYESGHERRQKAFHRDDDMHISVSELWHIWSRSEVHNWTVEQTLEWLKNFVQLPQYVGQFQQHNVNGSKLPRLAVNNVQYFSNVLGIKDPIHRQKIAVKAMDVVLFGPPKDGTNYAKDITLITLLIAAMAGGWYTYRSQRNAKAHLAKLMEHMDVLSSAEKELQELQVKLQNARQEQDITLSEKRKLEKKLEEETRGSTSNLSQADPMTEMELHRLREEVDILRAELQRAEGELEDRLCWTPPPDLQHWLQLTYELEQRVYNKKRLQAEKQLEQAKDACEKLNRKRSSFVASFVSTHGRTIDDVDKSIMEARSALMEVKQDLQERTTRWRQIESLCGFPIVTNPGLSYLETLLRNGLNPSRYVLMSSRQGTTIDEDADDTASLVSSCTALQDLVSTSTLVFLTSAAGASVASSAALLPYTDGRNGGSNGNRTVGQRKYPFLKRESTTSLESSASCGNGLASNACPSEIPKPSSGTAMAIRQRLNTRENSRDSAFDGSTVSSLESPVEEAVLPTVPSRSSLLLSTSSSKASLALGKTDALISPGCGPKPTQQPTLPFTLDRVAALTTTHNGNGDPVPRKSPLLSSKLNAFRTNPSKSQSEDGNDVSHSFKVMQSSLRINDGTSSVAGGLRKNSQSESALDVVFHLAQQAEMESALEENLSTDSSIPSNDDEARKVKKKQRFHFPNFVKRNKNKS